MPSISNSPTFQPDQRFSGSGSIKDQLFSFLQVSPSSSISLVMTQLASTVPAGEHHPVCLPLHLYSPQQLQASGSILVPLSPHCLSGEGAVDLALIQGSCGRHQQMPGQGLQQPWSPHWSQGPYHPKATPLPSFFNVLYNFGTQPSYMLGFCWLFILFLKRLATCSTYVQGEVDSVPIYLSAIF